MTHEINQPKKKSKQNKRNEFVIFIFDCTGTITVYRCSSTAWSRQQTSVELFISFSSSLSRFILLDGLWNRAQKSTHICNCRDTTERKTDTLSVVGHHRHPKLIQNKNNK